jgi:beta-N-acetylhexosaminidase
VREDTEAGETTRDALEKYPVGGLIYDASNFVSVEQTKNMIANAQSYSAIPLLITLDEEGGRVNRLMHTLNTTYIGPMYDYRDDGEDRARENAHTIAADIAELGFNLDLAPVADVWSNPANKVIGNRAYSDDFKQAAELIPAAVEGFHEGGVACTLKHFPGHGDTSEDSHYGSAYVDKTLSYLKKHELRPFRAGIEAGADCVMMGHLIVLDVEDKPALFSYKLVTELLREKMGFDGVVMTDSLEMKAMTDHYGERDMAVNAVKAGVDVLLMPSSLDETIDALSEAVESGEISEERINESVERILTLKDKYGLFDDADRNDR